MIRNTLAVGLGLFCAMVIITFGTSLNESWIEYHYNFPYTHWRTNITYAAKNNKDWFFIALLISCGFGATVGGVVTAILVKTAKTAYGVFIGFLLFVIAYLDIIFTPYHPTWYELSVLPVLFFFSWLGGKTVNEIYRILGKKENQI